MKFTKKTAFFLIFIIAVAWFLYFIFKPKEVSYRTEVVTRGLIVQEVSETGTVKKGDTLVLNFKNSGTIDKISVGRGDEIQAGQILAQLNADQLRVQLRQAQANLDLYRVQRDKLMNGASGEDITLAQTAVINAQAARDSANQALSDARSGADRRLSNLYDAASDTLNSAHAKAVNAGNTASLLQRTYFTPQDADSIRVVEAVREIQSAAAKITDSGNYEKSLPEAAAQLSLIADDLADIRAICEAKAWRDIVAEADKDDIATQRDYVIAALSLVNSAIQNIELQKVANDTAINSGQSAVTVAEGALQSAREQLTKVTAQARPEDIGVLDAQIEQAQAAADLLELQINDSQIIAPVSGQVSQVNFREGEAYMPAMAAAGVIAVIPDDPYFIEVDIYEEDVAKVRAGNAVTITAASSPEVTYDGQVVSIDPDSKTINGVVYYTTKIGFDRVPSDIKSGMSADVVITTAALPAVLLIPESALDKNGAEYFVRRLAGAAIEEVPVTIGIKSKGQVQIVTGLAEGDKVVTD